MIVGLTGGIGSGKSTVAKMFAALGAPVYNSDLEAKKLMNTDDRIKKQLITLFGANAYEEGTLNRGYIASKVFADAELLEKLNNIVHPAVRTHFMVWAKAQKFPYVIQETALIFENGMQSFYDKVILVTAPLETRVNRVVQRDNVSREDVVQRVNNQLDDGEKKEKSDYVIENVVLEETKKHVSKIHENILKQAV